MIRWDPVPGAPPGDRAHPGTGPTRGPGPPGGGRLGQGAGSMMTFRPARRDALLNAVAASSSG